MAMNAPALKAGQPTQLWTFANAVSSLNNKFDQNMSDSLTELLIVHRSLITNSDPMASKSTYEPEHTKEMSLHDILYTNITKANIADSVKLSKLLKIDQKECLRVICQISKKYPETKSSDMKVPSKIKLSDDFNTMFEQERLFLYTTKILREKRYILECSLELLSKKLDDDQSPTVRNLGKELFLSSDYYRGIIDALTSEVNSLIDKSYITELSTEYNQLVYKELLLTTVTHLKILVELSINNSNLGAELIQKWFKFMSSTSFTVDLNPILKETETECSSLINGLCSVISVALLSLDKPYGHDQGSFLTNGAVFKQINDIICAGSDNNAIIMYSWSIVLLRKYYILEDTPDQRFTSVLPLVQINESISDLGVRCQQLNVFHEIDVTNNTLKFDNLYSTVLSTLIQAAMPLISLTPEIATTIRNVMVSCPGFIIQRFFENTSTINALVIARAKFPYQLTPFLKLASINGTFALNELKSLKSYMCQYSKKEIGGISVIDDENTELVKLTKSIDVFPPFEYNNKLALLLAEDSKAKILPSSTESDVLVTFLYNYNGLALLGRVLQNLSTVYDPSDPEKISATIDILCVISEILKDHGSEDGLSLLETMSAHMDGSDVTETILRLLEQSLHTRNIKIAKTIFDLFYHLVPLVNERIWTYLSNSILLSDGGKEGFIATMFGSIEMINGDYSFTISFIKLTESLVRDCLKDNSKHSTNVKSKVLSQCINHLIVVFETFIHCRFNDSCQKMELGSLILDTFVNVSSLVYGLTGAGKNAVNEVFIESAKLIVDSFLIDKSDFSRTCYPLNSLIGTLKTDLLEYEVRDLTSSLFKTWISSVLKFSELIIAIRTSIGYPASSFETTMFNNLPTLVDCYAMYEPFRREILDLMASLTNGYWSLETRPSLLSHLGRNHTQILLNSIVTDLENDFDNYHVKVAIYDFISAVMKGDQEGLAVMLLGVRDIVNNLTKETEKTVPQHNGSLTKILRNNVKAIDYLPDPVALHLVDSMVLVINSSSSIHALSDTGLDGDLEYIDKLIKQVQTPSKGVLKRIEDYSSACYKLKLKSKIYEVLALYLFSSENAQVKKKITDFIQSETFKTSLKSHFTIKPYHNSLHATLDSEFKSKFNQYELSDFRCSLIKRNRFGVSTVYNLSVMDGMFSGSKDWPQLREKIAAAAVELQYISVQIDMSKSLGALITAFCRKNPNMLDNEFIKLSTHLLKTNVDESLPLSTDSSLTSEFLRDIYRTRIEVCFFMVYTIYNLTNYKKDVGTTFELLKTSSELLLSPDIDFINNLTQSTGYYRPLLRIIYCSLSMLQEETEILVEYFSIFRDLFEVIVSKGTKSLLVEIQNDVYLSKTIKSHESNQMGERIDDILLILSILKLFVAIKVSANNQYELARVIEQNGLFRALLNLYSFSHLIEIDGDYIFAQLSLMFIQELMKNDLIAQKLIGNGLFTVLQASTISNSIKNGDLNIQTSPQFHRIWTNGILPIFLYSLSTIGPDVLPDICMALTTFKKQIESCVDSWSKDSSTIKISTATINETSQILMIFQMLKGYNVENYLGITKSDNQSTVADVPVLPGLESEAKREDFMDYINNLLKHPKFLTSRITPSSIEEQKVIENGGTAFEVFVKNMFEDITGLKEFLQ